jgi:hypothetical protein
MLIMCKKRNMGSILNYEQLQTVKKRKIHYKIKRKASYNLFNVTKKQKVYDNRRCLIHEEEYICDIYECSGIKYIKDLQKSCFISYIN